MAGPRTFHYHTTLNWTGNQGTGTSAYDAYGRDYVIGGPDKPPLLGSSEPAFRGDTHRYNPEELLVASLSACHMLWYLHLCTQAGIIVIDYQDDAEGEMVVDGGDGRFKHVTLRPRIVLSPDSDSEGAKALHSKAHAKCFVANSVNFPVTCEPEISVSELQT